MGALLTLVVSAYFLLISHKLKKAFYFFIFLIPFLPKYIGFSIGMPITLKRIILMIFFMAVTISFIQNREYITKWLSQVYQQNKVLINTLLIFSALKFISLSLGSMELKQYIMLYNDFLLTGFVFVLTTLLVTSEEDIDRMAKIFFYGYVIVLILVLIESFIKHPLFTIFMSGEMGSKDYAASVFRGGAYRAQGSLTTSITLSEYLILLFPVVMAYIYRQKYSFMFKVFFFILFLYAVYATGSRGPVLIFAIIVYIYMLIILYSRGTPMTRFVANLLNIVFIGIFFYFAYFYVFDLINNFHGRFDLIIDREERSATGRAIQYVKVYEKISEAPFFGLGRMTNFTDVLRFTIDNRYFWMLLEVGIIGISVYFIFLFTLVKTAFNLYKSPSSSYYVFPILLSILAYIPYKFLTVSSENLIYIYIFAGIICVLKVLQNKRDKKYFKRI